MKMLMCWMGVGLIIAVAMPAAAEVNCQQVRLYAKTGRSVEDIAETMVVPVEEVQKCLQTGQDGNPRPTPGAAD